MLLHIFLALLAGYLIGNIQCAVLLSRFLFHDDVRRHGSGNAGSTNMVRVYGVGSGVITFAGDFLKAVAAFLLGSRLGGIYGAYAAALGVVLGHNFPALMHFRGGKGVACSLAIIWMLDWRIALAVTLAAAAVIWKWRMISLAAIVCGTLFLFLALLFGPDIWFRLLAVVLWALLILRHRDNIRRIRDGQEGTFSAGKRGF